jgi:hypothetical protein
MPSSHDDLLTPTEHQAAQLLVTLAWRLDGGQLASADQLLAKLCAIPTNDVAMASIVLLRQVAHSDSIRVPSCRAVLPAFCPTVPHQAVRTWINPDGQLRRDPATQGGCGAGGSSRTDLDEPHSAETARSAVRSRPCLPH